MASKNAIFAAMRARASHHGHVSAAKKAGYYRVKAKRHAAAAWATSGKTSAGHLTVARGFGILSGSITVPRHGTKHRKTR